ncbi:MAG: acyl-CoA dehydrogenase family protein [Pseudomonadota bacterium]
MSNILSEEQVMLRDMAKSFFAEKAPVSLHRELRHNTDSQGFSAALWQEMLAMGWAGIDVGEAYDGLGFGFRGLGIVMEEAGRTLAASPLLSTVVLGAGAIQLGGSDAQKQALLPEVVAGNLLLAMAIDEGAHHDPGQTCLAAMPEGDSFVLNGSKDFVIDGNIADKLVVAARTSGDAGSTAGLTLFLVDADAEGLTVHARKMVDSHNTATLQFSHVMVSGSDVLGQIDAGAEVLEATLDRGRIALAAEMLGAMQQAFENILDYLKERKQFGTTIGSFQALQHRAAMMFSDIEQCKSVVYEALGAAEDSRDDLPQLASMAKAMVNHAYHNISSEGIQMFGGMGMTDECDMGFYLKRARVAEQSLGSASYHQSRFATLNGF